MSGKPPPPPLSSPWIFFFSFFFKWGTWIFTPSSPLSPGGMSAMHSALMSVWKDIYWALFFFFFFFFLRDFIFKKTLFEKPQYLKQEQ